MPDYDVLIIGAGAAGLAAASALSKQGMSLAVLEARDHIGGRIATIHPYSSGLPVELGAEFVHGCAPETFGLAQTAGLILYERDGATWSSARGQLIALDDESHYDNGMGTILQALNHWEGDDQSFQSFINERFSGRRWAEARRSASGYVEGFDAAEPDQVSARWLAQSEAALASINGERSFRLIHGYDSLLWRLGRVLRSEKAALFLNTVVQTIHWSRGQVEVTARSDPDTTIELFTARAAIITLPLGVLAAPPDAPGAVQFTPDLPNKRAAIERLAMGHTVKVILQFREMFWEKDTRELPRMERLSFLFSDDEVMPTWWTTHPVLTPTLTGWAGGPRAAKLARQSDAAIVGQALEALARVLRVRRGMLEARLEAGHFHNWSADPYACGAYSYVRVGCMDAPGQLAAPVEDTLFFAGEATNTDGFTGLVQGALVTGTRAANEIIAALPAL